MSISRIIDQTMEKYTISIGGRPLLHDHIKQLNLYSGIGVISQPGDITITFDMLKMLTDRKDYPLEPTGDTIEIKIEDPKNPNVLFEYQGIITGYRKARNVKSDIAVLTFDLPTFVILNKVRYWKAYKDQTILQIFEDFLRNYTTSPWIPSSTKGAKNLRGKIHPVSLVTTSNTEGRGTFWEYFAIPQSMPTLNFLLEELAKDGFIIYNDLSKPNSIAVAAWKDLMELPKLGQFYPDYVTEGCVANFDSSKKQWYEATFVGGKQIDSRTPWKIQEWDSTVSPSVYDMDSATSCWYSAIKKPYHRGVGKWSDYPDLKGDPDKYAPSDYENFQPPNLEPWKAVDDVIKSTPQGYSNEPKPMVAVSNFQKGRPATIEDGYSFVSATATYPRFMPYRMRESYANAKMFIKSYMLIPGGLYMRMPLTCVPVTYFQNALNRNKDKDAIPDQWQSGWYIISKSQLCITGNNMINKLSLLQPYTNLIPPQDA